MTRGQKVSNAIREAFCEKGSTSPSLVLSAQEAYTRAWANLGTDPDETERFVPAEVWEALMKLIQPTGGNSPLIEMLQSGARLRWIIQSSAARGAPPRRR